MKIERVCAVYFSATGTTETAVSTVAAHLAGALGVPWERRSFTLPTERREEMRFATGDTVVLGVPVIAGRVPNVLLPYLNEKLSGGGALAIPVVLYGNRNYDDALMELRDILTARGFTAVAAAAFVGEHSFSRTLAAGRPDAGDLALMADFAEAAARKIRRGDAAAVAVRGETPLRPYYRPRDRRGEFINILKVKPVTDSGKCTTCGLCARRCPMGSIDLADPVQVTGICIKCCACVKLCPTGAKSFTDPGYLYHQRELEEMYARRAEPEMFL